MKRDFLTINDLSKDEILTILDHADVLKKNPAEQPHILKGYSIGLLFDKASTRTRVSFEVGVHQLGGHPIFLTSGDLQLGRGESIHDTARVLSRYLRAMVIRTYAHELVEEFAGAASIPVVNALTDLHHPCQALADLQTIREKKGSLKTRIAYVGDGNNVAHSLLQAAAKVGAGLVMACPPGHEPEAAILSETQRDAGESIRVVTDPLEAVNGAEVVYTDTWVSMGKESEAEDRTVTFQPYQVNKELLGKASPSCVVMHCLPAHRGYEITDDVMDGPQSIVFDQAENRLYVQMAVLEFLLKPRF